MNKYSINVFNQVIMKKVMKMAFAAAIAAAASFGFTACSSSDEVVDNTNKGNVVDNNGVPSVKPEFIISIPRTVVATRMDNGITQNAGTVAQFRGLDNIRLISFSEVPTASSTKLADILSLGAISTLNSPGSLNYKVYADQYVPVGTTNFLFYAKAIDESPEVGITTMNQKFHYGYLQTTGLTDLVTWSPAAINFSLEQINTNTDQQQGDAVGRAIVDLFTMMANTVTTDAPAPDDKWSTTTNPVLAPLYKSFIAVTTASSQTAAVILSRIYNASKHVQSSDPAYLLAQAIRTRIDAACTTSPVPDMPASLTAAYSGYPGNIGLPDGAARIRWNNATRTFLDITANYNLGNKVKITDYVYPANLWYYTNTPLKASSDIESPDYRENGTWETVISNVYGSASDEVQDNTQSVALVNQAQYGVGRIETKIYMGIGDFYDGAGKLVNVTNGYTLKGFLLGGQNSVGFDFTSKGNENQTIYDREMSSSSIIVKSNVMTSANQTLALETKGGQTIYAALELVNNGEDFVGADGIIPAGGTFYLTAKLDPAQAVNKEIGNKIVWQDHVTKLTITINNGAATVDRDGDGNPDKYVFDSDGNPIGVDSDGDGIVDPYDIDGDGNPDVFITDPDHGGPGWDTDGDGEVDIPVTPDGDGNYPDQPNVNKGLGNATNGIPNLASPGIELGTSVNLEWQEGLIITPEI